MLTGLPSVNIELFFIKGRAAYTRHVRKGVELPEIIRDDHYDFNFQVSLKNDGGLLNVRRCIGINFTL